MSAHCCDHNTPKPETIVNLPRYRKILWVALLVNTAMFLIEIGAGVQAGSLSLLADAVTLPAMRSTMPSRSPCWHRRWPGALAPLWPRE